LLKFHRWCALWQPVFDSPVSKRAFSNATAARSMMRCDDIKLVLFPFALAWGTYVDRTDHFIAQFDWQNQ
jgi:hypothetical protein